MENYSYIGDELDVFILAVNWKKYWSNKIAPYMGKHILEVGAGIGGTTAVLYQKRYERWLALEPDFNMFKHLKETQAEGGFAPEIEFVEGTVLDLVEDSFFDTIVYIDVLEHIEADKEELEEAAKHLSPKGHLIVLSPAFQFLYTEFDEAIGHFRRYRRRDMQALTPSTLKAKKAFYLDAMGLLASTANLLFLHTSKPNAQQIRFWDRVMVRLSRYLIDPLVAYSFGRSVIFVWQKKASDS
jgi:2-polyprenyl-3-methyl-5-hydroxy-6-metoxy-1,4-benzoquinol methylase